MVTIKLRPDAKFRREVANLEREMRRLGGKIDLTAAMIELLEENYRKKLRAFRHPVTGRSVKGKVRARKTEVAIEVQIEEEHTERLWSFMNA